MAFESEWSLDFCLSCDKQCSEGAYCSQACRVADVEKSGPSSAGPSSPTSAASSWANTHGIYLPPAIDFSKYNMQRSPVDAPSRASDSHPSSTTQSKRTSVASLDSSPDSPTWARGSPSTSSMHLPESTRQELRHYENSFDQSRRRKHRQHSSH